MNKLPADFRGLIKKWGDLDTFAADLGVPVNTAKQMRTRNSVPPRHHVTLIDAARRRGLDGVTERLLLELAAARRPAPSSTEKAA